MTKISNPTGLGKDRLESMHYDSRNGKMLAKFQGVGRVLEFDVEIEEWVYPKNDYDGYDRALYLGQGDWMFFEDISWEEAELIFDNKWFGSYLGTAEYDILLPDGRKIDVSRDVSGKLIGEFLND